VLIDVNTFWRPFFAVLWQKKECNENCSYFKVTRTRIQNPYYCERLPVSASTSLPIFQWQPFTIIQVLDTSTSYLEIRTVFVTYSFFCHENSKNGLRAN